jgi:shikimate dehydrogenase
MKLFGLIGFPLGHSFSVKYFANKFKKEEIGNCEYRNFPIPSIHDLPKIIKTEPYLRGLNVTIPYKQEVIQYINEFDITAKEIQAVNTIRIFRSGSSDRYQLKGYNTDIHGFTISLKELIGDSKPGALILGSGGASLAVEYALNKLGLKNKTVSRSPGFGQISYDDINEALLDEFKLIVNTTPLGTFPDTGAAPELPYHLLNKSQFLHDLVYNPAETEFMKRGKEKGARVKNGYQMLVEQAEKAWEIWNE